MFSTSETEKKLNVYQKDTKRQGEYPEIYFTGYAKKFFGDVYKRQEWRCSNYKIQFQIYYYFLW